MILIGLPHSEISGSTFATNYPELFAGDRVLHRHSAPRHPPCALCSLTYKPASSPVIDRADAIDMNGDRYVSSFDETRSSLLSSSSLVKVHHSFGRAHEEVVRVPERGVRRGRSSGWPAPGGSGAGTAHGKPSAVVAQSAGVGQRLIPRGGAKETRTPDPLLAKEVLYQLSYGPDAAALGAGGKGIIGPGRTRVGVSGLEPEASALSGQCSNQLS